jgi:hypothetical protein
MSLNGKCKTSHIYIIHILRIYFSSLLFFVSTFFSFILFLLRFVARFLSTLLIVCFHLLFSVGIEQMESPETRQRRMKDLEPEPSDCRV